MNNKIIQILGFIFLLIFLIVVYLEIEKTDSKDIKKTDTYENNNNIISEEELNKKVNNIQIDDENLYELKKYILFSEKKYYNSNNYNIKYVKDIINYIISNKVLEQRFVTNLNIKKEDLFLELEGKKIDYDNIGFLLSSIYISISEDEIFSQNNCISYLDKENIDVLKDNILSFKNIYYSNYIKSPYFFHNFAIDDVQYQNKINNEYILGKKISYALFFNNYNDYSLEGLSKIVRCEYFSDKSKCENFKKAIIDGNKEYVLNFNSRVKEFNVPVLYIKYLFGELNKIEFINKVCLK